jgi:hypothetical protein
LAPRTASPVCDLGLVDLIAQVVGCFETRRRPHHAVDVDHLAADPTDEVVVIVIDSVLEARGRPDGLNAPYETFCNEDTEGVVDGLPRDGADVQRHLFGDVVGGDVRLRRDRS